MEAVEKENKELKNVLPQVYGKANLDKTSLGELIDLISNTELQVENENELHQDILSNYYLGINVLITSFVQSGSHHQKTPSRLCHIDKKMFCHLNLYGNGYGT